eukprot:scaffold86816_cov58-Phaeocystis_antarctica.AAC.8
MLDAAARLAVDPLKAACAVAIQSQLAPRNALDVWRLADLYTLPALEKVAVEAALRGFEELPPQSATGAQVLALVQDVSLVAKSEEAVFHWVVRWWEAAEQPEAELLAAMKHVRFAAMDADFVEVTVRPWLALVSIDYVALDYIVLDSTLEASPEPRSDFGPRLVYVLGGDNCIDDPGLNTVDVYDPLIDAWKQLACRMPTGRFEHGAAALDGKIYVMGGCRTGEDRRGDEVLAYDSHGLDVYDSQTDRWKRLPDMKWGRVDLAAAAAGGKVYAVGGGHDQAMASVGACDPLNEAMASIEAFDPLLGAWAEVASMNVGRSNHAVAVVHGKIYAIGGMCSRHVDVDSVEMYDPQADSWQQVAGMPQARFRHAAAAMGGKIYVSGGRMGGSIDPETTRDEPTYGGVTDTLLVFDPEANTWTELATMGMARQAHTSAAVGGKLYVFGGYISSYRGFAVHGEPSDPKNARVHGDDQGSVEAYDPISNTWMHMSGMPRSLDEFAAVAL